MTAHHGKARARRRAGSTIRRATGWRRRSAIVLRRAHQKATSIFNAVMGEFGVTPTQFAALAKLDDVGRVSQNELGRLTAMDPATIWGVVNRLIKQGYVAQSPDPDDARLVMVELTDAGRKATLRMKAVAAEVSRETLRPLPTRRRGSSSPFSAGSED